MSLRAAINPLVMLMTKRFSVMRWRHVDAVLTRNMRQCLLENATRTIDRKKSCQETATKMKLSTNVVLKNINPLH